MKKLQYERIAQLVAISAINKRHSVMDSLGVAEQQLSVSYSDYVKSQIHLNIVEDLYGRKMQEYVKALDFVNGNACCRKEAERVLFYFYSDMANFLINNNANIYLRICVDADFGSELIVDLEDVKSQLNRVVCAQPGEGMEEGIKRFRYAFILDDVDSLDDVKDKLDSYALAAVLKAQVSSGAVQRLRLKEDGYADNS